MKTDKIRRLAKPVKKGIFSFYFCRLLLLVFILFIQFLLFIIVYALIGISIPNFFFFRLLLFAVMIILLINSEMDASAKLTWLFVIWITPPIGLFLLYASQTGLGHRKLVKRIKKQIHDTHKIIPKPKEARRELLEDGSGTERMSAYLNLGGCFPIYKDNEVTYYPCGEEKFPAMLEELRKAEHFIFLEYFIIEEGYMWGQILDILIEKAKQGVDVRVMYDGMCEIFQLPHGYHKRLIQHGIKTKVFSPIKLFVSTQYNYRDHRKILVIDGKVAFNGGINLADEYINHVERFGYWKDTAIRIKGPAVKSFTLLFLQMWNVDEADPQYSPYLIDQDYGVTHPNGYVMPYADCPLDDVKVGETVYIDILYRANHYVHIMTPYLILDDSLKTALKYAAMRGIDVKLILPGIPDKKSAYALAKSHYKPLLKSGVKIYEFTPGFVHAKVFVSDDMKATVGTINLDYRSLYHHYECATYLYKTDCIKDIEQDYQNTLKQCQEVTFETIKQTKLSIKIKGALLKFIAPLM